MDHIYNEHPESYMGDHQANAGFGKSESLNYQANAGFGDIWSDLRDQFNLPDTDAALNILKKDGVTGLKSAVASGVVNSDTANRLIEETAKEQGTQVLASNIRENWKTYLLIGGVVALAGAGVMFLMGRGSK